MANSIVDINGYRFEVYSSSTNFSSLNFDSGGVYIFTRHADNAYNLLYIGETKSIKDRMTKQHHQKKCVQAKGYNYLCIHWDDDEDSRLEKETDLRQKYPTPCNEQ